MDPSSTFILSTGVDNTVAIWDVNECCKGIREEKARYLSKSILNGLDHSNEKDKFLTSGKIVSIWTYERS